MKQMLPCGIGKTIAVDWFEMPSGYVIDGYAFDPGKIVLQNKMFTSHLRNIHAHPRVNIAVTYVEPKMTIVFEAMFHSRKYLSQPLQIFLSRFVVFVGAVFYA
jgi:hypothetical protein